MTWLSVIFPLDGSEASDAAPLQTLPLLTNDGVRATLLTAIDPLPFRRTLRPMRGARDELLAAKRAQEALKHLDKVSKRLEGKGVVVHEQVTPSGEPAEEISWLAADRAPAIIVLRTHGRRGLARLAEGSVTGRLLRGSSAPLLLLRGKMQLFDLKRILVPLDGSECAMGILAPVEALATAFKSEVVLLTVTGEARGDPDSRPRPKELLSPALERLRAAGIRTRTAVRAGDPAAQILAVRESHGIGLVAMTTRGLGGLRRMVFGSVAREVIRRAPVPTLVLPPRVAKRR